MILGKGCQVARDESLHFPFLNEELRVVSIIIELPILGKKQCKCRVNLKDFHLVRNNSSALFGLVVYNDPCLKVPAVSWVSKLIWVVLQLYKFQVEFGLTMVLAPPIFFRFSTYCVFSFSFFATVELQFWIATPQIFNLYSTQLEGLPCRKLTYPLQRYFWVHDFPFPIVGYVLNVPFVSFCLIFFEMIIQKAWCFSFGMCDGVWKVSFLVATTLWILLMASRIYGKLTTWGW